MVKHQRIYLSVGYYNGPKENIVNLIVEDYDREDIKDVVSQAIDALYPGERRKPPYSGN